MSERLTTLEEWAKARYGEQMPSIGTLRRWANAAPPEFVRLKPEQHW